MAIKGKKKAQSRGSQARRRPAAPPRPVISPRTRTPWYHTTRGRIGAVILACVALGMVMWAVSNARSSAKELERRQESLEAYTGEVRALLQLVRGPVGGMSAVPPLPDEAAVEGLEKDATRWTSQLDQARVRVGGIEPVDGLESAANLYTQAIHLYISAARTFGLAASLQGQTRQDALALAGEQRAQATTLWTEATALLDGERAEAEMNPSGLESPEPPAPQTQPGLPGAVPGQGVPGAVPGQVPVPDDQVEIPQEPEPPPGRGTGEPAPGDRGARDQSSKKAQGAKGSAPGGQGEDKAGGNGARDSGGVGGGDRN